MAGTIPRNFIDDVLERTDIVDIIDQRVPLRKAGANYKACCPFHDEKTPSFTVSQSKQFYHCFGCGANGNAISFLMEYDHMEFVEAIEELAGNLGLEVPREQGGSTPARRQNDELLQLLDAANRFFKMQLRTHPSAKTAINYLRQRGLSGEVAKTFELGFAPDGWDNLISALGKDQASEHKLERAGLVIRNEKGRLYDRFRGRVMFPIRDHRGRMVGFGGRILGDGEPKYLNSPETAVFHKGSELYGLYGARDSIREQDTVIVVEGYMDVVALAQFGIGNVVATLGTATTAQHLHRLFRSASHVVFSFDGDRAGQDAAHKAMNVALPEMHSGRQVSFLFLPEGLDPDDYVREHGAQAFNRAVLNAMPLDEFLFKQLLASSDLRRRDGRARLVELAKPLLNSVPPGPYKELLNQKLSELSGLDSNVSPPAKPAQSAPSEARDTRRPSPYAYLASLLLQHPGLVKQLPDLEGIDSSNHPAARPLADLVQLLKDEELTNTATIVERFRGTSQHPWLENLAARDHKIAESDLDETFNQYVNRVRQVIIDSNIDRLLDKATNGDLSDTEKTELTRFTALKQTLRPDIEPDR